MKNFYKRENIKIYVVGYNKNQRKKHKNIVLYL